ncbi:hypothetical protein F4604DRAFT_1679568 [Suillus subluteus]|nr:hypothetical protein F4604DRAFT_1679568 [Suillus subluteus]
MTQYDLSTEFQASSLTPLALNMTFMEQTEAAHRYRLNYYKRNCKAVLLKNKECYLRRKSNAQIIVNDNSDSICQPQLPATAKRPEPPRQLAKKNTWTDHNFRKPPLDIKSRLTMFLGGPNISLKEYFDNICESLLGCTDITLVTEDIRSAIGSILHLEKIMCAEEDGALQHYGVGPKLSHVQSVSKDVNRVLCTLEEIFLHILSDVPQLQAAYDEQELMFQVDATFV